MKLHDRRMKGSWWSDFFVELVETSEMSRFLGKFLRHVSCLLSMFGVSVKTTWESESNLIILNLSYPCKARSRVTKQISRTQKWTRSLTVKDVWLKKCIVSNKVAFQTEWQSSTVSIEYIHITISIMYWALLYHLCIFWFKPSEWAWFRGWYVLRTQGTNYTNMNPRVSFWPLWFKHIVLNVLMR